jgi:hypothetical protein
MFKCYINEYDCREFNRVIKDSETDYFEIYECFEPKKRKSLLFAVKPKWVDTNVLMYLTSEESCTNHYFKILNWEKNEQGREKLITRYNDYYNKYATGGSSRTSTTTDEEKHTQKVVTGTR